eukprot:g18003.t1
MNCSPLHDDANVANSLLAALVGLHTLCFSICLLLIFYRRDRYPLKERHLPLVFTAGALLTWTDFFLFVPSAVAQSRGLGFPCLLFSVISISGPVVAFISCLRCCRLVLNFKKAQLSMSRASRDSSRISLYKISRNEMKGERLRAKTDLRSQSKLVWWTNLLERSLLRLVGLFVSLLWIVLVLVSALSPHTWRASCVLMSAHPLRFEWTGLIISLSLVVLALTTGLQQKQYSDNFGIRQELFQYAALAVVGMPIWLLLHFLLPACRPYRLSDFWHLLLNSLMAYVTLFRPLRHTYKAEQNKPPEPHLPFYHNLSSIQGFTDFLRTGGGFDLYLQHLQSEFAAEALLFVRAVWQVEHALEPSNWAQLVTADKENIKDFLLLVRDVFVDDQSFTCINISGSKRSELHSCLSEIERGPGVVTATGSSSSGLPELPAPASHDSRADREAGALEASGNANKDTWADAYNTRIGYSPPRVAASDAARESPPSPSSTEEGGRVLGPSAKESKESNDSTPPTTSPLPSPYVVYRELSRELSRDLSNHVLPGGIETSPILSQRRLRAPVAEMTQNSLPELPCMVNVSPTPQNPSSSQVGSRAQPTAIKWGEPAQLERTLALLRDAAAECLAIIHLSVARFVEPRALTNSISGKSSRTGTVLSQGDSASPAPVEVSPLQVSAVPVLTMNP